MKTSKVKPGTLFFLKLDTAGKLLGFGGNGDSYALPADAEIILTGKPFNYNNVDLVPAKHGTYAGYVRVDFLEP